MADYGLREDGTPKSTGFLGTIKGKKGKVSTELSMGVNFDGKEHLIPALVPGLDKSEISHLVGGGKPTPAIMDKAVGHARKRMSMGMSPFYNEGEDTQPASKYEKYRKIKNAGPED